MLMHDRPLAVDLAVANGQTHHQLNFVSARLRSTTADKTMAERHVISRCDAQLANLKDTVPKPGEETLPRLPVLVDSPRLNGRGNIEEQNVRCVVGHGSINIFGANGLGPRFYELADLSFICSF